MFEEEKDTVKLEDTRSRGTAAGVEDACRGDVEEDVGSEGNGEGGEEGDEEQDEEDDAEEELGAAEREDADEEKDVCCLSVSEGADAVYVDEGGTR